MNASRSFAPQSFRDVTHHVFCSSVFAVPATVVVKKLKSIDSIKRYGVDGSVIGCCVMENLVPPDEIGATRRCTLRLPPYADKLVREKLTQYAEYWQPSEGGASGVGDVNGLAGSVGKVGDADAGELWRMEMCVDYVPCKEDESHRSPFEPVVERAVQHTRTQIRVSTVTRAPHRCFVEMGAECVLRVHQGLHATLEEKLHDQTCQRAVTDFWRLYLDAQLVALEQEVTKEAFPEVEAREDADYRAAFATHEMVLCDWAVDSSDTLPRHVAVEELESVLVWWARALEAYKHQKTLTDIAETRIDRIGPSSLFDPTRPLPRRFTEAEKSHIPLRRASEAVIMNRVGVHGGTATGDANSTTDSSSVSPCGVDEAVTTFLPPCSFMSVSASPDAFLRSSSHAANVTSPELDRQSALPPRDRRHTAVPKKSLVSATSIAEPAPPLKGLSQASSSLTTSNTAVVSTPSTLQTSVLSHSARRKLMAPQPPHLLKHAQRRMSNMSSFSNSASRYSAPPQEGPRATAGEPTGLFFSQFFPTPTYTAAAATTTTTTAANTFTGGAAAQKLLSESAAAPSGVASFSAAMRGSPPAKGGSTGLLAATAAAQASPQGLAPAATAEATEVFQPEMVRHLFSLTGVLQEAVARRVFRSLCRCDDDNAAATPPHLTADGLKNILRCLDLWGLRGGGYLGRNAEVAACDEAYRAEVHRCYHKQNVPTPLRSAKEEAMNAPEDVSRASTTDGSSTLSCLTARREASLRKSDEMALDKLVESLLSRFAYHKKQELSYEEFHLALLYLWNN